MVLADVSTNDALIIVAAISSVPATIAAVAGILNRRQLRIPSGGTIGETMERTHDLAAASVAHTSKILQDANGEAKRNDQHDS